MATTTLPQHFIELNVDDVPFPVDLRYCTSENLAGKPFPGYNNADRLILTEQAYAALLSVNEKLNLQGAQLFLYDAYRPQKAVDFLIECAQDPDFPKFVPDYYPTYSFQEMFDCGYIMSRSSHSRGSTADVTIVDYDYQIQAPKRRSHDLANGEEVEVYLDDGSWDMGTTFDYMDPKSHWNCKSLTAEQQKNRDLLLKLMTEAGFETIPVEWWHFTLKEEPYTEEYFNFDI